jgi:hypothetical protein
MDNDLKKAIVIYMLDNMNEFQLINLTSKEFKQYIYTPKGDYCIGGKKVHEFILNVDKYIINRNNN